MSDSPFNKKKILFLDDEVEFLETISDFLTQWARGEWEIHTASDTGKALAIIQEHPLDLVVVDLNMPVVDGVQFLQLIHRKYPNLNKVALTGLNDPEKRVACLAAGAELMLIKPANAAGLEQVFTMLDSLVRLHPQEGFRGVMRQVGLQELLQLECLGTKSSILDVVAGKRHGQIFIRDGRIIHAKMGRVEGDKAFYRILALQGGDFNLKPYAEPPQETISDSWESLVMEAARLRDEEPDSLKGDTMFITKEEAPAPAEASFELPPLPPEVTPPLIGEILLCSPDGDVLHEWNCAEKNGRAELLRTARQTGATLGQKLPLGALLGFESETPPARLAVKFTAEWSLLIHRRQG